MIYKGNYQLFAGAAELLESQAYHRIHRTYSIIIADRENEYGLLQISFKPLEELKTMH